MPKTETAPQPANGNCACLCGSGLNHPKSTFLQGHDQRFIGQLATEVVTDGLSNARVEQLQLPTEVDNADIQERINLVESAVDRFFSSALAAKFVSAVHRRWDKVLRDSQPKGVRQPTVKSAKTVKHPGTGETVDLQAALDAPHLGIVKEPEYAMVLGAPVKVRVGRWQYDATVHGMSQAGKVTAVRYDTAGGKEVVKTEGQFTIV